MTKYINWSLFLYVVLLADLWAFAGACIAISKDGTTIHARAEPADATGTVIIIFVYLIANIIAVWRAVDTE